MDQRQDCWNQPRTVAEVLADRRTLDDEMWKMRARGEVRGSTEEHKRYVEAYMQAFGITPEQASRYLFRDVVTSGTYKGFVRGFKGESITPRDEDRCAPFDVQIGYQKGLEARTEV